MKSYSSDKNHKSSKSVGKPRVLVISALPITKSGSTRAYFTYLHKIPSSCVAQIYTNPTLPDNFEICENFYQITDKTVFKNNFKKHKQPGLKTSKTSTEQTRKNADSQDSTLYRIGKKDFSIIDLFRSFFWKTKNYLTDDLKRFIDDFHPNLILYHNSCALFMEKLALTIKSYLDIPMVIDISDDYYFDYYRSINPLTLIKRKLYRKRFERLMAISSDQFYVSQKMADKYNSHFKTSGKAIYISSSCFSNNTHTNIIKKTDSKVQFGYFGNLGLGRDKELLRFCKYLKSSGIDYSLDVYTPKLGNTTESRTFKKMFNVMGSLPYEETIRLYKKYDFLIFVESKKKKMINRTRYCLSTKVGDYLSSGVPVVAIGSPDSGSIGFFIQNKCAFVLGDSLNFENLYNEAKIIELLNNANLARSSFFDSEKNSSECFNILLNTINYENSSN